MAYMASGLVYWRLFNGTFSTNRLYRTRGVEKYYVRLGDKTNTQLNNETKQ